MNPNTFKLIAQIGSIAVELGDYLGPVVESIARRRFVPPKDETGAELTVDKVQAKIAKARKTAEAIKTTAQAELDALDRKETRLDG